MTTFDEREKAEEAKFHNDQELAFKARARRNHLFGLWAAQQLGMSGAAAENYSRELMAAAFGPHGDETVIAKIDKDFRAKGLPGLDPVRLHQELDGFMGEAKKQLGIPR